MVKLWNCGNNVPQAVGNPFQPVLSKAALRKIRLHDLRHTFGSLLIQSGASVVYVKEQMGHSSIQVTVDNYGHLIPGGDVCFVDRLDGVRAEEAETPQQSAPPAQQGEMGVPPDILQVLESTGGGGRTRTYDLRIMRPLLWPPELRRHIVNKILILDFHRLFHLLFGRNTPK
jgi:Phage integrase family